MSDANRNRSRRKVARRCAMQSLYQALMTDQSLSQIASQFTELGYLDGADTDYFKAVLEAVGKDRPKLDELIARFADRPVEQIDPVEHATLLVAIAELTTRTDVPYRVIIDEAIGLSRRYGSTEGHRYVNAVVDRAAAEIRKSEYRR